MVNYYANSTEVLGDNYSIISLECDEYNPNIDGTVTLTVTAKSVYGNPIEDMEIPVTCSDGNFTELNGSSITGASTVTGTTDSNGEFTLTYACSEWGLITFSANNVNTQVNVRGWKTLADNQSETIKYNKDTVQMSIHIESLVFGASWVVQSANILGNMKDTLKPKMPVVVQNYSNPNTLISLRDNGELWKRNTTGASSITSSVYAYMSWHY